MEIMSAFQSVNTSLAPEPFGRPGEETTPTTPRPNTAPGLGASQSQQPPNRLDDAKTPTKASFSGGALASQRPLPESPFPDAVSVPETAESDKKTPARGGSQYSAKSGGSEDVDMDGDSDDGDDGSDEESVAADGTRTMKKKKSQRFFCTDYPPCNLSFTRSEHLARHIRKHTGERPFQCHCNRRFSRLDNLRQHAQTVHVNEEIPGDSLAATGTRFQRQIRTDRVRPPGNRSRANTGGSQNGAVRGHQRNSLSASSISSISSIYSQSNDFRRRPPPLVMAADPRTRLSFENYSADNPQGGYAPSNSGFSTPTSSRYSTGTGQDSPQWSSALHSPVPSHSRTASLYSGHRTPGRRLSVPSSGNPFQSQHGTGFGPSQLSPLHSGTQGTFSPAGSSIFGSPTSNNGPWPRRESINAADETWRRRTWHPETYSNFTSRLQNVTTPGYFPSPPPPLSQTTRLPGIESFDPVHRPITPPRRMPSPMMIDTPSRTQPIHPEAYSRAEDRTNTSQWDMNLHRNLNRLEIAQPNPQNDGASAWASEVNRAVQARAELAQNEPLRPSTVRFEQPPAYPTREVNVPRHAHHVSAPPITPRELKRQGWYQGPIDARNDGRPIGQRTSPEDSSSSENGALPGTPKSASIQDYRPTIMHSEWVEPQPNQRPATSQYPPPSSFGALDSGDGPYFRTQRSGQGGGLSNGMSETVVREEQKRIDGGMLRLEALVAVATGERENAVGAAY